MPRNTLIIIAFISLLARLISIASRPLWYDEAFAVLFAEKGFDALLRGTLSQVQGAAADVHPLAYYTLLGAWMQIFGDSPLAVRMLSIIFGLALVAVGYLLARELFGERTALVAGLLLALSPFQVHFAQEVRMYAMLAFSLVAATWALWKGMATSKFIWWLVFSGAAALAQYTHNLAAFYLLPLALTPLLFRNWRALRAVVLAGLGAVALYLPWLSLAPSQFAKVQTAYWTTRPGPGRLVTTLMAFVTNLPLPDNWLLGGLFISVFTFVLAAWQTGKALRSRSPGVNRGFWLAYMAITPPLLLFAFSQWQPVYIERALLPSGVMFLLWIGWALTRTHLLKLVSGFAFLLLFIGMAFGIYQHATYDEFPYAPFADLDAYLASNVGSEEAVLHSNKLTMLPAVYYDRKLPQRYLADPSRSGSDTLAVPTQKVLGLLAETSMVTAVDKAERVWFVIFERAIDEYKERGEGTHPHLAWLETHYSLERVEDWGDIQLYVYAQ